MSKSKTYSSRRRHSQESTSKLPLYLLIGGAVILLGVAFFTLQKKPAPYTPQVSGGPSLKVDKESVDLGDKKLGSTTDASFEITNASDQPLSFSKAPYIDVIEGC